MQIYPLSAPIPTHNYSIVAFMTVDLDFLKVYITIRGADKLRGRLANVHGDGVRMRKDSQPDLFYPVWDLHCAKFKWSHGKIQWRRQDLKGGNGWQTNVCVVPSFLLRRAAPNIRACRYITMYDFEKKAVRERQFTTRATIILSQRVDCWQLGLLRVPTHKQLCYSAHMLDPNKLRHSPHSGWQSLFWPGQRGSLRAFPSLMM